MKSLILLGSILLLSHISLAETDVEQSVNRGSGLTTVPLHPEMSTDEIRLSVEETNQKLTDGQGVQVHFAPGTYRVPLNLFVFENEGDAPLQLVADSPGTVFIRGSRLRTDEFDPSPSHWQQVEGFTDIYFVDWPYDIPTHRGYWADRFGFPLKREAKRSELLLLNGEILNPREFELYEWVDPDGPFRWMKNKPNNEKGDYVFKGFPEEGLRVLRPGEFAVADRAESPEEYRKKIFVRLPEGMAWSDVKTFEFGAGSCGSRDALLIVSNRKNLLLRNLTIEHAPTRFLGQAILLNNISDFRIEHCDFSRNGGRALDIEESENGVLTHCNFSENAQKGVGLAKSKNITFEHSDFNWNNWRGRYGFVGWDSAGMKIGKSTDVTIRDCNFVGNLTGGIWFDIDNVNAVVERVFVYGNFRPGVEFEWTKPGKGGSSTLRDSVIGENFSYGIFISDSADNRIEGNVVFSNGADTYGPGLLSMYPQDQIGFTNNPGRGPRNAEHWGENVVRGNLFYAAAPFNIFGFVHTKTPPHAVSMLLGTMDVSGNTFIDANKAKTFMLPNHDYAGWETWKTEATEAGMQISAPNRFLEETLQFGPDASGLLMEKVKETGIEIPWDLVEEWHERGGHPSRSEYDGLPMDEDEA